MEYLGHINQEGLHPTEEKVTAINKTSEQKNVTELKSFVGLLNYSRFLQNSSAVLHLLHNLLKKEAKWVWTSECAKAFEYAKQLLKQNEVSVHYNTHSCHPESLVMHRLTEKVL